MFFLVIILFFATHSAFAKEFQAKNHEIVVLLQDDEEEQLCHCLRLFDIEQVR